MLTRLALRNPVAILMVSIAVVVLGWVSVSRIPVDLFPDITIPMVMVGVVYPGAGPKDVEASVTQQLERAVSSVPNVSYIESVSRQGISIVRAYFNWGADVDVGASDAIQRVQQVMSSLPVGARAPFVVKMDLSNIAVVGLTVSGGGLDERALYDLAYNVIQPQIERIDGVSTASVSGGLIRQIQVIADRDALSARGLSASEVVDAISRSNFLLPSGNLRIGEVDYNVFAETQIREVETIRDLVVRSGNGGNSPIHVRDVADVVDGSEDLTNLVRVNGVPGVNLWVRKQPGSNTIEIVDRVLAAIPELRGIPAGVVVERAFDQSTYIRKSIQSLVNEALLGAFFAIAVIFVFLRTLRATAVITLAIPLSILATFILLYFVGGQSLNTFTLGGLALGVGRLVDDSIVVLENIFRHRSRGSGARQAALEGTREVAMPVLASTVATIAVFFPVIFLAGIAKLLFIPLTLAIVFALLTSYAVAMAVIPPLSLRFVPPDATPGVVTSGRIGRIKDAWRRGFEQIEGLYVRSLRWGLSHRLFVVGIVVVLFSASMAWIPRLGTEFFPATDESQFSVSLRAPIGTRVEATANDVTVVEKTVFQTLGTQNIMSVVTDAGVRNSTGGAMWSRNTGPHAANVRVRLVSPDERSFSDRQAVERVRKALDGKLPGTRVFFDTGGIVRRILNFGSDAPLDVEITGYDLDDAREVYTRVRELVESVPGAVDVRVSREDDYPELQVRLDHQKIAALGVSPRDVAQTMLTSVAGNINTPGIFNDPTTGREYWIVVRLSEEDRASLDDLEDVPIALDSGRTLTLRTLGDVVPSTGPVQIDRKYQERVVHVTADVRGRALGDVARDIESRLADLTMPEGFSVRLTGERSQQQESFGGLTLALALALMLVYMAMASQFRSLREPFIVMFSVPMGMVGVVALFAATGTALSVSAFMGIIMMVGIVMSNGILLVEFANVQREQGLDPLEAIVEAGRVRLRPILMTTATTLLGLTPMAIGIGEGSESNVPLARAVVGGLFASTAFTLVLVPILYTWLRRSKPRVAED